MTNYQDRDLSWLSFNERVLLEATNDNTPLMERLKFIAIYSANQEEFYKVRVAGLKFEQRINGDKKNKFGYRPSFLLQQINTIVSEQHRVLGTIFRKQILPRLSAENVHLVYDNFTATDTEKMLAYFKAHLQEQIQVEDITNVSKLDLKNQAVYLYLINTNKYSILELDYKKYGRFICINDDADNYRIVQLDDIYRLGLAEQMNNSLQAYAIKISRDAELYLNKEEEISIIKKVRKSIRKRESGLPSRLLFDERIAFKDIDFLRMRTQLDLSSLVPGGKYHNFYDYFGLKLPASKSRLFYSKTTPMACSILDNSDEWFSTIDKEEVFLSFPYQQYNYTVEFLKRAVDDDAVKEIFMTLYRVAEDSEICKLLRRAAKKGKKVFVLAEVKARFDEESNIKWGRKLEQAGATVKYELKNLKVHAKVILIQRQENDKIKQYAYLGTGNFNEKTANIYCDHALLTSDKIVCQDLQQLFTFLQDETFEPTFNKLWVAPFELRDKITEHFDFEIAQAKEKKKAQMQIKLNSLEDIEMIDKLRHAADQGVKIKLLIRGICCYTPLNAKQRKNISIVRIVDRFLEHTRIYSFYNAGTNKTYLSSADWMKRNLSHRIEVAFPIENTKFKKLLLQEMKLQQTDAIQGTTIDNKTLKIKSKNKMSAQQQLPALIQKIINI